MQFQPSSTNDIKRNARVGSSQPSNPLGGSFLNAMEDTTHLKSFLANSTDVFAEYDSSLQCTFINLTGANLLNTAVLDIIGKPHHTLIQEQILDCATQSLIEQIETCVQQALATAKSVTVVHQSCGDNQTRFYETIYTPVLDMAHTPVRVLSVGRDVTSAYEWHQQQQAELRPLKQRLRLHANISPLGVVEWDCQGRVLTWSQRMQEMFGRSPAEVLGQNPHDCWSVDPQDAERFKSLIQELCAAPDKPRVFISRSYHRQGQMVYSQWFNAAIREDDTLRVYSLVQDITPYRQTLEALGSTNSLLRAQQEAAIDGILVIDNQRRIVSYNHRFCHMWGIPAEVIQSGQSEDLLEYVMPQLREPTEFLAKVHYLYNHPEESSHDELHFLDGRVFERHSRPVLSSEGTYSSRIWFFRDITERKEAEAALQRSEAKHKALAQQLQQSLHNLQQTQTQLIHSEKMSGLGQMVAGVAHEINNPISFISGNLVCAQRDIQSLLQLLQLYQQHYPDPIEVIQAEIEAMDLEFVQEDLPKLLNSLRSGAERITEIVQSLRNFARLDEADMKPVDIHEGLDNTLLILRHRLYANAERSEIKILKEYDELPLVTCYARQLNQVFINLLGNAIDAINSQHETWQAQLEAGNTSIVLTPPQITIRTRFLAEKSRILIQLQDNGPGMPEDIQSRIFDPFFTTKPVGQGTGLGLSVCYQIVVEKHDGQLICHSTPGQGTTFEIEIPTHQDEEQCKQLLSN